MRIFIGFTDVANIAATYAKAFQSLGHETFTAVWSKSRFYPDSLYDLVIYRHAKPGLVSQTFAAMGMAGRMLGLVRALTCDLCLMFAPAVLPSHLYYPILKRMGKKIVTAFWGSDIRYWYAFEQDMRQRGVAANLEPFIRYTRERSGGNYFDKLRTVRTAEKYSDLILSQPDCAQLETRPYMRANVPLDLSRFQALVPDRVVPLILHAPSIRGAKGTEHIIAAVEQLKSEGVQFDFQLIENMPNAQLRELLTQADIVVDELYALTVGGLSAEAMASGCAVLVSYDAEYSRVPSGCPAINTHVDTLVDHLRQLIVDRNLRRHLALAGRPYVEAHNDHIRIAQQILDWVQAGAIQPYDFVPTFYRDFTMPADLVMQERAHTWTRRKQFIGLITRTGGTRNN